MNKKQMKTLEAVFKKPTPANIEWNDVVSLLKNLGAEISEKRSGLRIGIFLNGHALIVHTPHPQKEMKRYVVEEVRELLKKAGVTP